MGAFDIFALTSVYEGLGLVLLEAMAARRPVVATRVSAIPEVVADGETGILVGPREPEAVAAALDKLHDRDLRARFGEAGRLGCSGNSPSRGCAVPPTNSMRSAYPPAFPNKRRRIPVWHLRRDKRGKLVGWNQSQVSRSSWCPSRSRRTCCLPSLLDSVIPVGRDAVGTADRVVPVRAFPVQPRIPVHATQGHIITVGKP